MPNDPAPTADELRNRIDRGLTGDKVAHPDPAAAPLGTDAEAAGAPPTDRERTMARRPGAAFPATSQSGNQGDVVSWPAAAAGAALFLLAGAVLVSQRLP